jgi:hypothetical protein|tara:strand:+ start:1224 stop:2075 length:852 start_codon:yes stop_codon:yes gene_type:complete
MAHEGSINEEETSRDVPRFKSSLEDIDFAVYNFLDETMDLQTKTNKGHKKVPVIWAGSERAHNIKTDDINRDLTGMVVLPVMSVERTSVKKDEKSRVIPYAKVDPTNDLKGGYLTVNKVIKQDKTRNFANADAYRRRGQKNFPLYKKDKNGKIVYETITIPIPIYVNVGYKIVLRTEYQEQMNDMMVPLIRVSNAHKRILIQNNSNQYEAFFGEDYTMSNNISSYETNERKYETSIDLSVFGYLIGDGPAQKQPSVVRRENAVQIRFARERIILQDEDGEFRF